MVILQESRFKMVPVGRQTSQLSPTTRVGDEILHLALASRSMSLEFAANSIFLESS